jgi:methylated-DNA-[protein]-cysteine S-methyltransferase
MHHYSIIDSPIGELMLVADASALTGLYFVGCDHIPVGSNRWTLQPQDLILRQAEQQLLEYFAATRRTFSLPLSLTGTAFQEKVWQEIARIPYGTTATYSDLAERAGSPQAIRAAGTNTGRNPISIMIPCHRVVGKNGEMCGFAGGLKRKRYLLELEQPNLKVPTVLLGSGVV